MSPSFSDQDGLIFQLLYWTVTASSTRISPAVSFLLTEQHTINFAEQSDIFITLYGLSWLRTLCSVYLRTHWDGNRLTSLLLVGFSKHVYHLDIDTTTNPITFSYQVTRNLKSQFFAPCSNTLHTKTTLASSPADPCLSTSPVNSDLSQKADCRSWWCFSHVEVPPKPPLKCSKTASLVKCVHNKHMPLHAVHHLAQCTLSVFIQLQVPGILASFGTTIYFTKKSFIAWNLKVNGLLSL